MNPIRSKHIVIGLAAAFILFLFSRIGEEENSYEQIRTQSPMQYHPSYRSFEGERNYTTTSTVSNNPTNPHRHEVLQSKVKGYREGSYWGEQTSTAEKVKHFSGDEFDRFIEEAELNDADVYWGATY